MIVKHFLMLLGLLWLCPSVTQAANLTVTTSKDEFDGQCDSHCSLRDALRIAQKGDTLTLPQGVYSLTEGELRIKNNLGLIGAGIGNTILEGNKTAQLLHIHQGTKVTLQGITFQNGGSPQSGGCLVNAGNLTVIDSQFLGCTTKKSGGAIINRGTLKVVNTTFNGNQASELGGALEQAGDTTELIHCTFENNTATRGGAIHAAYGNTLMQQTQMTKNSAQEQGGGLWSGGNKTVGIEMTTIQGNTAPAGADCLGMLVLKGDMNAVGNPKGCVTLGPQTQKKPVVKHPTVEQRTRGTGIGGSKGKAPRVPKKITPVMPSAKVPPPVIPKGTGIGSPKPKKP